ncbi:putative lipoprotein LpqZ [Gordonia spumicola]|uniref:Putative lipoprotein LpqZ n=1 Tax=Gordonia spumicola TaxID=589161 RepID=A0A7I9V9L0_9ACTN|nr:glycine betaine ABC transporter substrate-binding protein [Gordonia spumicola]GEE02088.1 putative lipoprotein LpqZ [Gordonia spumicola]
MRTQRRLLAALLAAALAGVLLTACSDDASPLLVGHDGTPEMRTAAAIYAGALSRTGIDVETADEPTANPIDAVASGDLGLFPAFTGDLLRRLTPNPTALTSDDVLADVNRSLPQQVSIGDPAAVSNRWQVVVRAEEITDGGPADLVDCDNRRADRTDIVSTRPLTKQVTDAFARCGIVAATVVPPAEFIDRVRAGALGLAPALDTASVVDLNGVRTVTSEGGPIAQDLVPVFASAALGKSQLKALSRVAGELTTTDLAQLVREVRGGASPSVVAGQWLSTHGV